MTSPDIADDSKAAAFFAAPCDAEEYYRRGLARLDQRDALGALKDFQETIDRQPDHADAWNNLGMAQLSLGYLPEALAAFDRALESAMGPLRAIVLHNRGTARHLQGNLPAALTDFDQALAIAPDQLPTVVSRGKVRMESGALDGALADFDGALSRTQPAASAPIYYDRGGVRILQKDWSGAIAEFDKALSINPNFYLAYLSRGSTRYHRREFRLGLADYYEAFRLDPEGSTRELVRLVADMAHRDPDGVLANCDQHLRIHSQDPIAHARRGLTLLVLGRETEARPHWEHFRALAPHTMPYLERVIETLKRQRPTGTGSQELAIWGGYFPR
jgi:tetratricopeptide (TPR) repeat protein